MSRLGGWTFLVVVTAAALFSVALAGRWFLGTWERADLLALIAAVMALIALLPSLDQAVTVVKKAPVQREPANPVAFAEHELATKTNARFGFSFKYPRTWAREDPENSDGYSFAHPTAPGVLLTAYGSRGLSENLWDEMRQRREWAEEAGATFLVDRQADSDVYLTSGEGSFDAPGWLQRREQPDHEVGRLTIITRVVWAPGRYVTIEAQAPDEDFPRYERALDLLTATLRVTRECDDCWPT